MNEGQREVAWLVIEPGWEVVGTNGARLGKVHEVVGDTGKDIFNGLAVKAGLLRASKYVPAERVSRIVEGRVEVRLDSAGFDQLDEHEPAPASAEILPPDRNV